MHAAGASEHATTPPPIRGRHVTMRRLALSLIGIVLVGSLAGCGAFQRGPSYESAKSEAISLREELEATLPEESVSTVDHAEIDVACNGDAVQFDGIVTVSVPADFDRAAWLDEAAAMYADRSGWKVQKKVAADGSSDATSAVSFTSEDGYYMRLGEFPDTSEWGPVVVLSASGPCTLR